MTRILWDVKARAALARLPQHEAKRIINKLTAHVAQDAARHLERLVGLDFFKVRVGDYRLFVDFYPGEDLLIIRAVRHRRNAYK